MLNPIFVRGLSRSGGTLLVTVLDAHPAIAMSYELYPTLLDLGGDEDAHMRAALALIGRGVRIDGKSPLPKGLRVLVARCLRGGLSPQVFAELVEQHWSDGFRFADETGRFRFIERCCERKRELEHKLAWGLKCNNQYDLYRSYWPDAVFINIMRDARDVFASQKVTGAFNKSATEVASGWVSTHGQFLDFMERHPRNACLVQYERLVTQPAVELSRLCAFLGVPFVDAMLAHHTQDLTIYQASHLSMDRISKPIDSSQVGRWRGALTSDEVGAFKSIAGELMSRFGYGDSADAEDRKSVV